ncbi:MAG: energy transducer TonB [Ignavibacteriaceae bacterium]
MKTKLFFLILLFVIPFGCKEEKQIEVIPDYDKIYFPLNKVDQTPQLFESNEEELIKNINSELAKIEDSSDRTISLDYNFMLDENGTVDKVEIIQGNNKKINNLVLSSIKNWRFKSGIKDGKNVKSQYRWKFHAGDKEIIKNINEGDYFVAVEEMPEPIGGMYSIQSKIKYPEIAKRAGIEGKVYVLALIDEDGNVASARIIKGIGAGCDEAALDAVTQTKFKPGRQKGKPVKVQVSIPIVFKLQ